MYGVVRLAVNLGLLGFLGLVFAVAWGEDREAEDGVRFEQGPEAARAFRALAEPRARPESLSVARPEVQVIAPRDGPAPSPDATLVYALENDVGEPVSGRTARLALLPRTTDGGSYWPRLATIQGAAFLPEDERRFVAVSDEAGQLRFEGVPGDRRIRIDVEAHDNHAATSLLDTSVNALSQPRTIIRLRSAASAMRLQVEGLPPHEGTACVLVRRPQPATFEGGVIARLWVHGVEPLDAEGSCVTPPLPDGPFHADVWVPDIGLYRNLRVSTEEGGTARAQIPRWPTATLRGRLLDPAGRGVKDARVALAVTSYLVSDARPQWVLSATSDEHGKFAFPRVPIGVVDELHVDAPGYVSPRLVLEKAPIRPGETLDVPVQLIPGCIAVGRVLDAVGRPVKGASVLPSLQQSGMWLWPPRSALTDAEGRWYLDRLPPGPCKFTCSLAESSVRADVEAVVSPGATTVVPPAFFPSEPRGGRVEVLVVGPDGAPEPGAYLVYRIRDVNSSGQVHTGPTNAEGRYVLDGLQLAFKSFEVWARKWDAQSAAYPVDPEALRARSARVHIHLPPVGRIRGSVLDKGRPVAGAIVSVRATPLRATTDHQGMFHIPGLSPGSVELEVGSAGGSRAGEPVAVLVRADETTMVTLAYERPTGEASIVGRLLDPAGHGFPRVALTAHAVDGSDVAGMATTEEDGGFSIDVARPGLYELRSGGRKLERNALANGDPVVVVFDAGAIRVVQGRILTHDGLPAAGGIVSVRQDGSGRNPEAHGGGGYFRMELGPDQRSGLDLEMSHGCVDAMGRRVRGNVSPVPFKPDETISVRGPLPPAPAPDVLAFRGCVVDASGAPLRGAILCQVEGDHSRTVARTGVEGTFVASGDLPESIQVIVIAPNGYRSTAAPRQVRLAEGPLRIVLPVLTADEVFTATVTLVDRDGQPVPGLLVTVGSPFLDASQGVRTGDDGTAVFPQVPRGRAKVDVHTGMSRQLEGYEGDVREGHVWVDPENPQTRIELRIRKRRPADEHDVLFKFEDPVGEILPEGHPHLSLHGLGEREGSRHDYQRDPWGRPNAEARIAAVPAGRYRVQVGWSAHDAPYLPLEAFEVEVPGPPIVVALRRAVVLHGRVEGESLFAGTASFFDEAASIWHIRPLAENGVFTLNVDPAAMFTIYVRIDGKDTYGWVDEARAADAPIRVKLDRPGQSIRGRVEGLKRLPDRYELEATGAVPFPIDEQLAEGGTFHFRGLPPGVYAIAFNTMDVEAFGMSGRDVHYLMAHQKVVAGNADIVLRPRKR